MCEFPNGEVYDRINLKIPNICGIACSNKKLYQITIKEHLVLVIPVKITKQYVHVHNMHIKNLNTAYSTNHKFVNKYRHSEWDCIQILS